jgi:hypothetical protein
VSPQASVQLRLIAEIVDVAHRLGVPVWLRGGWAMDFYLGRVTREHRDIDWFVGVAQADGLVAALEARGFVALPGAHPEIQRDLAKDGEDVSLALVGRDADGHAVVPAGPYAGERWPAGMLGERIGRIGEQSASVIEPAAQVEIKTMMPVWVPGMRRRAKDLADIALLEAAIDADRSGPVL